MHRRTIHTVSLSTEGRRRADLTALLPALAASVSAAVDSSSPRGSHHTRAPGKRMRGRAEDKYQWNGEVPHAALLFSTVLKKNTTPSGQSHRCQKYESTSTVQTMATTEAARPCSNIESTGMWRRARRTSSMGAASRMQSHRSTAEANASSHTHRPPRLRK